MLTSCTSAWAWCAAVKISDTPNRIAGAHLVGDIAVGFLFINAPVIGPAIQAACVGAKHQPFDHAATWRRYHIRSVNIQVPDGAARGRAVQPDRFAACTVSDNQ